MINKKRVLSNERESKKRNFLKKSCKVDKFQGFIKPSSKVIGSHCRNDIGNLGKLEKFNEVKEDL